MTLPGNLYKVIFQLSHGRYNLDHALAEPVKIFPCSALNKNSRPQYGKSGDWVIEDKVYKQCSASIWRILGSLAEVIVIYIHVHIGVFILNFGQTSNALCSAMAFWAIIYLVKTFKSWEWILTATTSGLL